MNLELHCAKCKKVIDKCDKCGCDIKTAFLICNKDKHYCSINCSPTEEAYVAWGFYVEDVEP